MRNDRTTKRTMFEPAGGAGAALAAAVAAVTLTASVAGAEIADVGTGMIASERLALAVGVLDSGHIELADDRPDTDRIQVRADANADLEDDDDGDRDDDADDRDDDDDRDEAEDDGKPSPVSGRVFNDDHRDIVRQFFQQAGGDCPAAGLEVREDGLCGPRNSERMWTVGKPLAESVKPAPVPASLMSALPTAGPQRAYGLINGDIVLYDTTSRVVIDAVIWDS